MARYIAFDIGDRRIGVAVSDPFNSYALPSQTYVRTGFQRDIAALSAIIKEKGATHIVCGLPVNADGTPSEQTEKTERFIRALEEATGAEVVREDERYTSIIAHEQLHESGRRAKEHKKYVDALAAASILDGYLSKLKKQGENS
ncbi:MAG TPA: Holliday junction resolvase RuvX [Candidatus Coproplasma stercoripullorum]|uniref:Putative pre-16S rRNA nuclease n=1 Tax=Candidatus Coproplasma stercoripullorum TaxID=2840751 RepID=A0A9D1AFT5_9FIRM|nr:Holliday junction resolvase RuvX [Candidatus Coproplasma stercoripullorum]